MTAAADRIRDLDVMCERKVTGIRLPEKSYIGFSDSIIA